MKIINDATAWLVKEFDDSTQFLGQRWNVRITIQSAAMGYIRGMAAGVNPVINCIFGASQHNLQRSFGKIPAKAVDFIADHSLSILLNKAGLTTFDNSIRTGIKCAIYATMIAVSLNALGFSAGAITTAKVTFIAKTILLSGAAEEAFKGLGFKAPLVTIKDQNRGFVPGYLLMLQASVIASTVFGWNPLVMSVISSANALAREFKFTDENSYFVSRDRDGIPVRFLFRNEILQTIKTVFNYAAVTTVAKGALHLAGKVVMQNPQTRVALAVAYLALAYLDPYAVRKVEPKGLATV